MGKVANLQALVFSERNQLSQAILQFHMEQMLNGRTQIARFESQHNNTRDEGCVLEGADKVADAKH